MNASLLSQVLESACFRNKVTDLAIQLITSLPTTAYPKGAATPAVIVDYEFTAPMTFGPALGEGMRFHFPFEAWGVAAGQCKTCEENYTYARDGKVSGKVMVEFGPHTLVSEELALIAEGTALEISFQELSLDDESPTQGPPEKFAGES